MFAHVSVWGVLLAALSALPIGMAWYSNALFGKQWSKVTGVNEKAMKDRMGTAMPIIVGAALVTAYALSLVIVYLHAFTGYSWMMSGIDASLLASIGFAATTLFAHGAFMNGKKVVLINAGNRVVTLFVMGLIIAAFLR